MLLYQVPGTYEYDDGLFAYAYKSYYLFYSIDIYLLQHEVQFLLMFSSLHRSHQHLAIAIQLDVAGLTYTVMEVVTWCLPFSAALFLF